jgi:hypothetical protein
MWFILGYVYMGEEGVLMSSAVYGYTLYIAHSKKNKGAPLKKSI